VLPQVAHLVLPKRGQLGSLEAGAEGQVWGKAVGLALPVPGPRDSALAREPGREQEQAPAEEAAVVAVAPVGPVEVQAVRVAGADLLVALVDRAVETDSPR